VWAFGVVVSETEAGCTPALGMVGVAESPCVDFNCTARCLLGLGNPHLIDVLREAALESGSVNVFLERISRTFGDKLAGTLDEALGWRLWVAAQREAGEVRVQCTEAKADALGADTGQTGKRQRKSRWQIVPSQPKSVKAGPCSCSGVDWTGFTLGALNQLDASAASTLAAAAAAAGYPQTVSSISGCHREIPDEAERSCVELYEAAQDTTGRWSVSAAFRWAPFLDTLGLRESTSRSLEHLVTKFSGDSSSRPRLWEAAVPKLWRTPGELCRASRNGSGLLLWWLQHGKDLVSSDSLSLTEGIERYVEHGSAGFGAGIRSTTRTCALTSTAAPDENTASTRSAACSGQKSVGGDETASPDDKTTLQSGKKRQSPATNPAPAVADAAAQRILGKVATGIGLENIDATKRIASRSRDSSHDRIAFPPNIVPIRCTSVPSIADSEPGDRLHISSHRMDKSTDNAGDVYEPRALGQIQIPSVPNASRLPCAGNSIVPCPPNASMCAEAERNRSSEPAAASAATCENRVSEMTRAEVYGLLDQDPESTMTRNAVSRGIVHETHGGTAWVPGAGSTALPIAQCEAVLLDLVERFPVVLVVGETGSGKSTQIPQFLWKAGWTRRRHRHRFDGGEASTQLEEPGGRVVGRWIGCTQPRRLAATRLASRVAAEMQTSLGGLVGYTIRFDDRTGPETEIKYMTDGVLLREAAMDPMLSAYNVLIVDEAHERSLHTDLLLTVLKRRLYDSSAKVAHETLQQRLLIASATLDAGHFTSFFANAPVLEIPGKAYPVEIRWVPLPRWRMPKQRTSGGGRFATDYLAAAVTLALDIHFREADGDILAFLPGQDDVEAAVGITRERAEAAERALDVSTSPKRRLVVLPLYANMSLAQQQQALARSAPGTRKCIFATNVAETSLTIDGVRYVIDSGLAKQKVFLPNGLAGVERLILSPISQASARQRAGRAGRTAPGYCFRLYSRGSWEQELLPQPIPEISRTDLSQLILNLLQLGVIERATELLERRNGRPVVEFLDPPPAARLVLAMQHLWMLAALEDATGQLTPVGARLAQLPLDPRLGRFLLAAVDLRCLDEALTIVSMLSVGAGESSTGGDVWLRPRDPVERLAASRAQEQLFAAAGDIHRLLQVYSAWTAASCSTEWCEQHFVQCRALRRARSIRHQLERMLHLEALRKSQLQQTPRLSECGFEAGASSPITLPLEQRITLAFLSGFYTNIARLTWFRGQPFYLVLSPFARPWRGVGRRMSKNPAPDAPLASIHPSSCLRNVTPPLLAFAELVETQKLYLRCCVVVPNEQWLRRFFAQSQCRH
jgi:HrpA-like RNA helicase